MRPPIIPATMGSSAIMEISYFGVVYFITQNWALRFNPSRDILPFCSDRQFVDCRALYFWGMVDVPTYPE